MNPAKILKIAERRGLNAIAITDHNTITGGVRTFEESKEDKSEVIVITGAEIATNKGDLIGLFLNEEIKSKDVFEVIDSIRAQGGLVLIPHPFNSHKFGDVAALMEHVDLLEIYNSRYPINPKQKKILETLNKPLVAGSDAHFYREIGLCLTLIYEESICKEEIRRTLLRGKIAVLGMYGPFCFKPMSQIIKGLKCKDAKILGMATINFIRSLFYESLGRNLIEK